jgi:hypothetical protein
MVGNRRSSRFKRPSHLRTGPRGKGGSAESFLTRRSNLLQKDSPRMHTIFPVAEVCPADPALRGSRDAPPLLSNRPIWSPIPARKEIGRAEQRV